jgi:phosphohistidine phosphatase SixA
MAVSELRAADAARSFSDQGTGIIVGILRNIVRSMLLALTALALVQAAEARAQTTLVILVRHAEQETGQDPELNAAGKARAQALINATANAGISAIYHTPLRRTTETARPVADKLQLEPVVMGPRQGQTVTQHAAEVAADITARQKGKTVLVVGHSNTVPAIINALGVSEAPVIADTEYAHFFVVVLAPGQPARLIHSRYGS